VVKESQVDQGQLSVVGMSRMEFIPSENWPSEARILSRLFEFISQVEGSGADVEFENLPKQLRQLYKLYKSGSQVAGKAENEKTQGVIEKLGNFGIELIEGSLEVATFTGQWVLGISRVLRGQCVFSIEHFWQIFKTVTVDALPIVTLISFLVGLIISFLGAVVLIRFGAEFAVSYLVGYGMFREMGALMTGIIMSGRTGAAFAAQIASMKVNEELDALKTFGISPIDFVVLPRLLALFIAMPLLTLYANIVGVFGGYIVAVGMMQVPSAVFFSEMQSILSVGDFFLGIGKATIFGLLIGSAGCLRGLQSGSGSDAVGVATTRAVVTGITLIILTNAIVDWAAASFGF
jgi:phospholipid/cholesterol/gamma-HCH transport system permease protein